MNICVLVVLIDGIIINRVFSEHSRYLGKFDLSLPLVNSILTSHKQLVKTYRVFFFFVAVALRCSRVSTGAYICPRPCKG